MKGFFITQVTIVIAIVISACTPKPFEKNDSQKIAEAYSPPEENAFSNPTGMHFSVKKYKDVFFKNVGTVTAVQFVVRGATVGKKYILWCKPLGRDMKALYEYDTDDYGLLGRQLGPGTMMLDDDILLLFDFFKGEPVKYYLTSFDKSTVLQTEFVPYPICTTARDEAQVTLKRLVPDASLVLCEGEGFLPDEHLLITTQSGTVIIPNKPVICTNGKFSFIFEPAAPKKSGGIGYVEIRRFSERLVVDCDWGCEAFSKKKLFARSDLLEPEALLKLNSEQE
jgi:hypothetical protein